MTSLPQYMEQYTSQNGYPMVTVSWVNPDGETSDMGSLQLTQQRHFLSPYCQSQAPASEVGYTWWIPLTLYGEHPGNYSGVPEAQAAAVAQGGFTTQVWATTITNYSVWRDGYLKLNAGATGYYRVMYPPNILAAFSSSIENQLSGGAASTSAADRGQLVDDLFTFAYGQAAQANGINMAAYFDFITWLGSETEYEVWMPAVSSFSRLRQLLYNDAGVPAACMANMSTYAANALTNIFGTLGFVGDQSPLTVLLRTSIISAGSAFNLRAVVDGANDLYAAGPETIAANIQAPVLASAVRWAPNRTVYDTVRSLYISATDANLKRRYVGALAATQDVSLLASLLQDSINSTVVRSQDTVSLVVAVSSNPLGRALAWNFVKANWDLFVERYGSGGFSFSDLVYNTAANFQSQAMFDEIQNFYAANSATTSAATLQIQQALEMIGTNLGWVNTDLQATCDWLHEFA
jgi:aminopeptidase N